MSTNSRPRFLADNMLGRLAKWLRIAGYDTRYLPTASDGELARVARAEGRILLTRDEQLAQRRGVHCVFVHSDRVEEQLQQLMRALELEIDLAFSRCPTCNRLLEAVPKEAIRAEVPPYVFATREEFRRCPQCARVYWRGTHWARMNAQLEDLRAWVETCS
jgi:uncharacterized protein with PIN domain